MNVIWYVVPWVFGSVLAGLLAGCLLSRSRKAGEDATGSREQQAALHMLSEVLNAAERMAHRVADHDSEIRESAEHVHELHATGEMETVKAALLKQMKVLLDSNERMKDDLLCTRYRLEEQAVEIDRARREARTDNLTGVGNRRSFDEKLHVLMDEWRRLGQPFVLILADLDKFKWINDAHGHVVGDRVLATVGSRLKQSLRDRGFVGRYGGDEFAILLPQTTLDDGMKIAEMLRRQIAGTACCIAVREGEVALSISVGVAAPCLDDTDESLLERADRAMYDSKRLGRDHVLCRQPEPVSA